MKNIYYLLAALCLAACNNEADEFSIEEIHGNAPEDAVCFTMTPFEAEEGSRTNYDISASGVTITWAEGDVLGVFPGTGNQTAFNISAGAGSTYAIFDGQDWRLRENAQYAAYFPLQREFDLDKSHIEVDYSGQTQDGNNSTAHLGQYDFMYASFITTNENGNCNFQMKHLGTMARFQLTMPEADTYTSFKLTTSAGEFTKTAYYGLSTGESSLTKLTGETTFTLGLQNITTTAANQVITLYAMMAPGDYSAATWTLEVVGSNRTITRTISGKNIKAGKIFGIAQNMGSMSVRTLIIDGTSQPPLVGGYIDNYDKTAIVKKGMIVSKAQDDLIITNGTNYSYCLPSASMSDYYSIGTMRCVEYPEDKTVYDFTYSSQEEFCRRIPRLIGDTYYYVRAFIITTRDTIYGDIKQIHTLSFNRSLTGGHGPANVYLSYYDIYDIFDLTTDEVIDKATGYYASWNESPDQHPFYTSGYVAYKFKTIWNYYYWRHFDAGYNQYGPYVPSPTMYMNAGNLNIEARSGDMIYYQINGDGLRPENFTQVYTSPLTVSVGDVVYCYAIDASGVASYTNAYMVVGSAQTTPSTSGILNGHGWVDLGLPSGTLWATCNIGASSPEEYGDYFAWGETEPYYTEGHSQDIPCENWKAGKSGYNWASYKWCNNGERAGMTKYTYPDNCTDVIWYSGSTFIGDNKTVLESADDAATANRGGSWRMPTMDELNELRNNCTWTWTTQNGVNGYKVVGPNGNFLFLPAAGGRLRSDLDNAGSHGHYWSSSIGWNSSNASCLAFYSGNRYSVYNNSRYFGFSVRPVCQ